MAKTTASPALEVQKTYKLYIGGKFPRTDSGRYYPLTNSKGRLLGNICRGTRKDFRNAMVAARSAQGGWNGKTAYNRSQILYRIAEMLQGRAAQFIDELVKQGSTQARAQKEVEQSIDRLVYYAGWCDKYQQIFSSVNPVASSHFNFSVLEPMGVIAVIAPEETSLLGLVSVIAPIIAGGNTCVVLCSESHPLCAITFGEVINSSDVPGGVVNLITGFEKEIYEQMATHMDVNAVVYCRDNKEVLIGIKEKATSNVKRVIDWSNAAWNNEKSQSPYHIADLQETKTTWHPIENIGGTQGGY